jgi:heme a synthase
VLSTAWSARKLPRLRQVSLGLFAVLGMQFMTGLATIFFSWPLSIAVLHNAGAAILVSLLCVLNFRVFRGAQVASPQVK